MLFMRLPRKLRNIQYKVFYRPPKRGILRETSPLSAGFLRLDKKEGCGINYSLGTVTPGLPKILQFSQLF